MWKIEAYLGHLRVAFLIKNAQMALRRRLPLVYKMGLQTRTCTKCPYILGGGQEVFISKKYHSPSNHKIHLHKGNRHEHFKPWAWGTFKLKCLTWQGDEACSHTATKTFYFHWNDEMEVMALGLMNCSSSPDNVWCGEEWDLEREELGSSTVHSRQDWRKRWKHFRKK